MTTTHHLQPRSLALLSALLLCTACDLDDKDIGDGTTTGDGDGDGDGPGTTDLPGACGLETTTVLDDLDAIPDTFELSVNELLAGVVGSYSGTFAWHPNDGFETAHAGSESPVTMSISHVGGEARLFEVPEHGNLPGGQLGGAPCSNSLEIDVSLSFSTQDGLFAEQLEVVLHVEAMGSSTPYFNHDLDFATHQGSLLHVDFSSPGFDVERVVLGASFAGATGDGGLSMEVSDGSIVGYGLVASFDARLDTANSDCGSCEAGEYCLITLVEDAFGAHEDFACTATPEGCAPDDCECIAAEACPGAQNECLLEQVLTLDCALF